MVMTSSQVTVRPVMQQDRQQLANLVHFEAHVHRHLDWRPPLDWVGCQPYLVAEHQGNVLAALVCPPDPPEVAWIRLFAVSGQMSCQEAWELLWPMAQSSLDCQYKPDVAALSLQRWFTDLLEESGFTHTHDVVLLQRDGSAPLRASLAWAFTIRSMLPDDLPAVAVVDQAAFIPEWRNTLPMLELAYQQAAIATLAEDETGVLAYQISTSGPVGGHLARLAVVPSAQGRGIGYALVHDVLEQFGRRGALHVTVNTQKDNLASLALYAKAGFHRTGEEYPMFKFVPSRQHCEE
jgi:ribosomal protein S18 acetylase RimI-like enzyme